ncbi:MAG: penicillin-binding transpeptidase domain-containing protein [Chloroflexota bacterium]|nr:penicillin-binding transpeptidase domain-containing protein [Chloroflexota bacterium]
MSLDPKNFYKPWLHTEHDPEGPPPDTGTRWRVFRLVIVLSFLILVARLWQLQIVGADRFEQAAANNSTRRTPIEAQRGVFYDRTGVQLTANVPVYDVSLTLAEMPEDEAQYQAALRQLDERLNLGAAVAIDAGALSKAQAEGLAARLATLLEIDVQRVRAAIAESRETEGSVLLRDELTAPESENVRSEHRSEPAVLLVSTVQWRVENSGVPPFRPALIAEGVARDTALTIEGERILVPGLSIQQAASRAYPKGPMFAGVLGYVGKIGQEQLESLQDQAARFGQRAYALDETVGKTGLEGVLEPYLRGSPGSQEVEVTITNRVVRQGKLTEPVPGGNVMLTLDAGLQGASEAALLRAIRDSGAKAGAAVALDPRTGQVLALVSLPSYDNNAFIQGISQKDYRALTRDPSRPLLNKAISGQYEPGAVIKPFIAAGGLAERVVDPATTFPCAGSIEVPVSAGFSQRQIFADSNRQPQGAQTVAQALASGCDTYFYILAGPQQRDSRGRVLQYYEPGGDDATPFRGLGIERMNKYLNNFRFGSETQIDLPGEATGLVADNAWKLAQFPGSPWTLTDSVRTAVGRGYDLVTPIQMAAATAAIANGGTVYQPELVLRITNAEGRAVLTPKPEQIGAAGMTPDHLQTVREGMRLSVERGGASRLRKGMLLPADGDIAAMTGTPPSVQRALDRPVVSWFTGFAPYAAPEIAVAVVLDGGDGKTDRAAIVGAAILQYHAERQRP